MFCLKSDLEIRNGRTHKDKGIEVLPIAHKLGQVQWTSSGADPGLCARGVQKFARALARAQNSGFSLIIHDTSPHCLSGQQAAESRFCVASEPCRSTVAKQSGNEANRVRGGGG